MNKSIISIMLIISILGKKNIFGLENDNDLKHNILTSKVLPISVALGVGFLGGFYVCNKITNDNSDNLNYEEFFYESKESVNKIEIDEKYSDINVSVGEVSNVKVNYYQNENKKYKILEEKGTLKIKKLAKRVFAIFGGNMNEEKKPLEIIVPKNKIDLNISSSHGDVNLKNIVSRDFNISTSFGDIYFEHLDAKNIKIKSSFGDVSGSLVGSEKDYSIDINTMSGKCNLKNSSSGSRKLNTSSSFGDINISFEQKPTVVS